MEAEEIPAFLGYNVFYFSTALKQWFDFRARGIIWWHTNQPWINTIKEHSIIHTGNYLLSKKQIRINTNYFAFKLFLSKGQILINFRWRKRSSNYRILFFTFSGVNRMISHQFCHWMHLQFSETEHVHTQQDSRDLQNSAGDERKALYNECGSVRMPQIAIFWLSETSYGHCEGVICGFCFYLHCLA